MDCSTPGFPIPHHLPELAQTHTYWVCDAIQPSHPLSSPLPAFNLSQHQFSSIQFSHSVVSDSLQAHEPQHARPPCPLTIPRAYPNSCPFSRWCHPTISSSVVPFSSCPQSFPASGSFLFLFFFFFFFLGGQGLRIFFYFIFKLYIIVLVLPNIKMNPPQAYMCFPTLNPPPSSLPIPSLWVVPVHQPQASSIVHRTWTGNSFHTWYYTYFNAIVPNLPTLSLSHRVHKTVLYICVSFAVSYTGLLLPSS